MLNRALDQPQLHLPVILSICTLLYFPFLGARDFWDHENLYAEVTRVMFLDEDYVIPKMNGELMVGRPPLFFWLASGLSQMVGEVNEWTIRLIPALAATVLIMFFYLFLKKSVGSRIALLSTVVLATSLLTIHVERHVPINMVFFLLVTIAMFFLRELLVFDSTRSSHAYGAWCFMALACLTKGPVAVVFPGLVVGVYLIISDSWKKFLALRPITGALLFCAMTMPWYVLAKWKTGRTWTGTLLGFHSDHGGGHQAFYDYIAQFPGSLLYAAANFPLDFMPWSFFLIPAVINLWPERGKVRDKAVLFLFLWFLSVLLFPHLSVEDHSHYLFLALFPTAIAVGMYLDRLLSSTLDDTAHIWTYRAVMALSSFLILAGIAAPIVTFFRWSDLTLQNFVVGVAAIVGGIWLRHALKIRNYSGLISGAAILLIVINLIVQGLVLPPVNRLEVRPFAEQMRAIVKRDGKVGIYLGNRRPSHDLNFYSRVRRFEPLDSRQDIVDFLRGSGPKFVVAPRRSVNKLRSISRGELNPVLVQSTGGPQWWFPLSKRWILLYSCKEGCDLPSHKIATVIDGIASSH